MSDLLRLVLLSNRPRRMAQAGFVLPTTVLLVLMVVLTATALTYRTLSRSQIGIAQREQVRVANVAAPAIDRAKSKIEFIFTQDPRFTSGLPTPDILASLMLDAPYPNTVDPLVSGQDPFTMPGETRIDINGDGKLDNAWSFTDSNTGETVAYSILVESEGQDTTAMPGVTNGADYTGVRVTSPVDIQKAKALVTRTGPVAATSPSPVCVNARAEAGWEVVDRGSSATLQKNFQVNVFVPNGNEANRTLEAFEFQQARIAERGNKWAAWFRYDLEIYPGQDFSINGAMHTDSNLIVGTSNSKKFESFKISSHNSCVYGKEASEITVGIGSTSNPFQGQIVRGLLAGNDYQAPTSDGDDRAIFHIWDGDDRKPITNRSLTGQNDSVTGDGEPADIAVNPLVLFTEDKLVPNNKTNWQRNDAAWNNNPISTGERILNRRVPKPFVDDLFRADNRWGPKPRYSETIATLDITNPLNTGKKVGDPIAASLELLNAPEQGLDGFWERQAIANGLRIVVGERLELGNPLRWNDKPAAGEAEVPTNKDRLYPANAAPSRTNMGTTEYRQKRSLRDNLAAVQGMVVYHYEGPGDMATDGNFPAACVAFTSHPGTPQTIVDSRTFGSWATVGGVKTDFIHGQGTNGWEFKYHPDFDLPGEFAAQVANDEPLGKALRNLAYFAGDPKGGAPSFPAVQDSNIHPFPHHAMWGDYSNLRRIIEAGGLNNATAFGNLSPADKATVHSAACTLSLLAYNLEKETSDYLNLWDANFSALTNVTGRFGTLIGGITQYMSTGDMPNQFKIGSETLDARLTTLGLSRETWWANNKAKIAAYLGVTSLADSAMDATLETYFADKAGMQPGGASDYFASFTFEQWLSIAPFVTGGVPEADLQTLRNFSDQVNQFNSIVRDRDLGFKPGLTRKDVYFNASNREINWNEDTKFTQPVDIKTGVKVNTNPKAIVVSVVNKLDEDGNVVRDAAGEPIPVVVQTTKSGNVFTETLLPESTDADGDTIFTTTSGSGGNARTYNLIIVPVTFSFDDPYNPGTTVTSTIYEIRDKARIVDGEYELINEAGSGLAFKTNCDPNIFRSLGPGGGGGDNNVAVGGLIGCSARNEMPIRTPSLFYLFPLVDHSLLGTGDYAQPTAEEYISRINTYNGAYTDDADLSVADRFQVIWKPTDTTETDPTNQRYITATIEGIKHIAAVPKLADLTDWVLPVTDNGTRLDTTNINSASFRINRLDPTDSTKVAADVAILDKGMFDGREQLAIRVADLDMSKLTTETVSGGTNPWIPDTQCIPSDTVDCNLSSEGIVYAFREDAVREDEIVRPKKSGKDVADCLTIAGITSADCRMNATSTTAPQDPPLTAAGISLKPVDFVADPDRRPHGFRFREGADMSNNKDRDVGMTFVTDNSVYVMGDFNLHSTAGTPATVIEEFDDTLGSDAWTVASFYDDRETLNTDFAKQNTDTWRPVEILADAFTILSDDFRDGAVEDTFIKALPSATDPDNTSYMNQTRPETAQAVGREDGTAPAAETSAASPVYIDRNGRAYVGTTAIEAVTGFNWTTLNETNERRQNVQQVSAADVRVNAVFISGIVPSRANQGYGGLHNFPRLLEHWDGKNLIINGAFLQLNFATGSTGPYEHDAWEPNSNPGTAENLGYYSPGNRRWGYDPGLLYYPPAAASRRFATVGTPRSEYFRDLPADDPYITLLRCAEDKDGNPIFTDAATREICPA